MTRDLREYLRLVPRDSYERSFVSERSWRYRACVGRRPSRSPRDGPDFRHRAILKIHGGATMGVVNGLLGIAIARTPESIA